MDKYIDASQVPDQQDSTRDSPHKDNHKYQEKSKVLILEELYQNRTSSAQVHDMSKVLIPRLHDSIWDLLQFFTQSDLLHH